MRSNSEMKRWWKRWQWTWRWWGRWRTQCEEGRRVGTGKSWREVWGMKLWWWWGWRLWWGWRDDGQGHDASKDEESKALTPHPGKWIQAHTPKPRQHIGLHLTMHKKYPACTWHFGWEVWGDKNNQDIVFYESFKCRLQVSFGESFLCFWNSRLHLLNQRIVPCFILCLMKVMKNQIQSKFYQQFSQDLQTTL